MRKLLSFLLLLGPVVCACGQGPSAAMGDTWHNLTAVQPHAYMHVSTDQGSTTCHFIAADEESLTCGHSDGGPKGRKVFPRASVKTVKLTRYAVSTVGGVAIGAGVGAAVGFGSTQNPNGWFNGAVRGVMTGLGGIVGGAAFGLSDAFRGPTIYRRPKR